MRTLGRHLDRVEPHEFKISWNPNAIKVEYRTAHGNRDEETLTVEKLRELTLRMRFRRAPRK
jgi:hypothetical protein